MNSRCDFLANLVRAQRAVAACCTLLLFASGCASNVLVNLRPYEAQAGNPTGSLAQIRIEAVKDARADAVGSMIGERTTIGNVSMGGIDMNPPPTDVMARVLKTEFTQMGYAVVSAAEQFTIGARLRRFQVLTPATALYWDITGAIELEMAVTARDGTKHEARYATTCTERTYVWPSEDIIGSVVSACLGKVGAGIRGDAALAGFLGGR